MKMIHNGKILVPAKPAEEPRKYADYVQRDLIQSQLPRFIQTLNDEDGDLQAVVKQEGGIMGRLTVLYRHWRKFECEIYC